MLPFHERLQAMQARTGSRLAIGIAPNIEKLPAPVGKIDDPFLPLGKLIIDTTADLVCAYVFHLGAYLSIGAAGAVALERTLGYVPQGILKILHGPFASDEYVRAAFDDALNADAVTLASLEVAEGYLARPHCAAFVERDTPPQADVPPNLGIYHQAELNYRPMHLISANLRLDWRFGEAVYRTRTFGFEAQLRAAGEEYAKHDT